MQHIKNFLESVNSYPFHMPGHKRNKSLFPTLPLEQDITEIEGADNLHNPTGVIKSAMEEAARLWGAKHSYFLVNGSTCGILAGVGTLTKRGDTVVVSRNCHRSVFHALELFSLKPVFLQPETVKSYGGFGSVSPIEVERVLKANPNAKLVIITSPTYEGVISNVKAIHNICHRSGVKLLVDEAHGAHLDLSPYFIGGAVAAGADIVVQSLHKTLPALTQTAILHSCGDIDEDKLRHQLAVFQSSSPSYLLMASAEHAVAASSEAKMFAVWAELIAKFTADVLNLKSIKLATGTEVGVYMRDPSKLVLTGKNGIELAFFLRERGIETEYSTKSFALAMTGVGDSRESFEALASSLYEADKALDDSVPEKLILNFCNGEFVRDIASAKEAASVFLPIEKCLGRVAAEYLWAYPPGIPLLVPGQRITAEFLTVNVDGLISEKAALPHIWVNA